MHDFVAALPMSALAQATSDPTQWWLGGGLAAALAVGAAIWFWTRAKRSGELPSGLESAPRPAASPPRSAPSPGDQRPPSSTEATPAGRPGRATESDAMRRGLTRTRNEGFVGRLGSIFRGRQLDPALLEEVEEVLYTADLGVSAADKLLAGLKAQLQKKELDRPERVWSYLRSETRRIVADAQQASTNALESGPRPVVVMVVGVNGTGKTTTIGKISHRLRTGGHKVLVVAADTFRAAAVDQLGVWADRAGVDIWKGADEADPASVVFDGVKHGVEAGYTAILVDTAGRLHTAHNLVSELQKVWRVTGRALPGAPHETWLVLDATMGQNAIQQARIFLDAVQVSGLVLTKLDGTAKGGVVIGICDEMKLPIRYIGVGEGMEDLRPFDADAFIDGLYGETTE